MIFNIMIVLFMIHVLLRLLLLSGSGLDIISNVAIILVGFVILFLPIINPHRNQSINHIIDLIQISSLISISIGLYI